MFSPEKGPDRKSVKVGPENSENIKSGKNARFKNPEKLILRNIHFLSGGGMFPHPHTTLEMYIPHFSTACCSPVVSLASGLYKTHYPRPSSQIIFAFSARTLINYTRWRYKMRPEPISACRDGACPFGDILIPEKFPLWLARPKLLGYNHFSSIEGYTLNKPAWVITQPHKFTL